MGDNTPLLILAIFSLVAIAGLVLLFSSLGIVGQHAGNSYMPQEAFKPHVPEYVYEFQERRAGQIANSTVVERRITW